ncbi:X-box-binding protein 1-like [Uranotaenia lowii]|uniref:X-box-binding protein 1-like n=1 Tax=Uranotaenia lowii TaxID=190385 RepID=UPI0024789000|nr:X-box-binding protein 1-like [Uranotaenia lowii]
MSAPLVITVPTKYIPINLAPVIGTTMVKKELKPIAAGFSDGEESVSSMEEFLVRGKKRRLDHLTWEEKIQRKKLKNRVAAQTSRDRKKAKMEDMEKTIQEQSDQIAELQCKCDTLQSEKNAIYEKYFDLENRFDELKRRLDEQLNQQQQPQQQSQQPATVPIKSEPDTDALHSVGSVSTLLGSAASAFFPLQQGSYSMETQTTLGRAGQNKSDDEKVAALWKIIALCLLYRTCSKSSTCPSSKSSPKVSWPTSPASWKTLIESAASQMPKMQAPAAGCLDQWWGPQQNSWNPAKKAMMVKEAA